MDGFQAVQAIKSDPLTATIPLMRRHLVLAIVLLASIRPAARQPAAQQPDWKGVERDAIQTLQDYVRINTSNPPGDVTKAADFLIDILKREGIPVTRYESGPGRSIVLARLEGSGTGGKAILLESHMPMLRNGSIHSRKIGATASFCCR